MLGCGAGGQWTTRGSVRAMALEREQGSSPAETKVAAAKYCPQCGAVGGRKAGRFCEACGARLPAVPAPAGSRRKRRRNTTAVGLGFVVGLSLNVFGLALLALLMKVEDDRKFEDVIFGSFLGACASTALILYVVAS